MELCAITDNERGYPELGVRTFDHPALTTSLHLAVLVRLQINKAQAHC